MFLFGRNASCIGKKMGCLLREALILLAMIVLKSLSPVSSIVSGLALSGVQGSRGFLGIGKMMPDLASFGKEPVFRM